MVCSTCGRELLDRRCAHCEAAYASIADPAHRFAALAGLTDAPTFKVAAVGTSAAPTTAGHPSASPVLPTWFGSRYRIGILLGVGGMGAVYEAWDAVLGLKVALKIIRPEKIADPDITADVERRFKNELVLARQVTHKNVVRIHDLGEIDGIKYITMTLVEGRDLATVLRREGPVRVRRALHLARQISAGLEAAHEAAVVHRDLKPANIMVGPDDVALIMDFGVARSIAGSDSGFTVGVVGTLKYMAPEQATAGVAVDQRADIYAFGLIFREMLVGPGAGERGRAIDEMRARLETGLASVRSIDPTIPEAVDAIVTKCVEIDPLKRYQTSTELVAALAALNEDGVPLPRARAATRRQLAVAAVIIVAMLGGTYVVGRRARPVAVHAHEPVPVLVADFDNRTHDSSFDGSVEQALALALESASYITVFKTSDARALASRLSSGRDGQITPEVAQLIARREGIKVLIDGTIDRPGAGYRVDVRAIDPANGRALTTASRTVADKAQVLTALSSMATTVREALGESTTEMAKVAAAETVTAGSLDAMRAYARGQELQQTSQFQDALREYQRAVKLDPQFGRAYAGIAGVYVNYFKQPELAEAAYQEAMKHLDRMTEREKYRTLGTYYLDIAQNFEKAIENFETLVRLYPSDNGGHGNLALAYLRVGNVSGAVTEVRKSLEIYPGNSLQRYNYAMYSMYAGDFSTAIAEAGRVQKENPTLEYAWLPFALSNLIEGNVAAAHEGYARLARMSAFGASFSGLGEADIDLYFGRATDAVRMLQGDVTADRARHTSGELLARKRVALAEAYLATGQRTRAAAAADEAARTSRDEGTLYPAARVLLHVGHEERALQIGAALENMLQRHTVAYARLISAEIAGENARASEAIEDFRDAQKRHDSWFGRYLLGKAYVEAGHAAEGLSELELCVRRRGETADAFFSDMPTLRYLPPLYYWLARAQEATGVMTQARLNYREFLKLRADADPPDPMAEEARRRLQAQ